MRTELNSLYYVKRQFRFRKKGQYLLTMKNWALSKRARDKVKRTKRAEAGAKLPSRHAGRGRPEGGPGGSRRGKGAGEGEPIFHFFAGPTPRPPLLGKHFSWGNVVTISGCTWAENAITAPQPTCVVVGAPARSLELDLRDPISD